MVEPGRLGEGQDHLRRGPGRFNYVDGAKRYAVGVKGAEWKRGEPKLFDPSNSISQFDELPASDVVEQFPCDGCPSSQT